MAISGELRGIILKELLVESSTRWHADRATRFAESIFKPLVDANASPEDVLAMNWGAEAASNKQAITDICGIVLAELPSTHAEPEIIQFARQLKLKLESLKALERRSGNPTKRTHPGPA